MALNYKWGTVWKTVPNGELAFKWGTVWVRPSYMRIKYGSGWIDTDYRGYPAVPTGLAVYSWPTHEAVQFKWTAGAGGAPVSSYDVELRNSGGVTVVASSNDAASPSVSFTQVVQQGKYQVFVRARTAGGQVSAYAGPLKIEMGKDAYTYYTTETATRNYSLAKAVTGYKDAAVGPTIPTSVLVTSIRYQITNGFSGVLSPYGTHSISRWANSAEKEQFSWPSQTIDTTVNVSNYTSNGGVQGMICRGTGWSLAASGSYVATGTITVTGVETYSYQQAHNVAAIANGYW